jgi:hypothetical protein
VASLGISRRAARLRLADAALAAIGETLPRGGFVVG